MRPAFHTNDVLVIRPADDDDPEALARKGQCCRFMRYGVTGLAVVEIEGRTKPMYFRAKDLMPYQDPLDFAQGAIAEAKS